MAKHLTRKEKIALTKLVARGWTYAAAGAQFGRSRYTAHDIFWSHAKRNGDRLLLIDEYMM